MKAVVKAKKIGVSRPRKDFFGALKGAKIGKEHIKASDFD